MEQNNLKLQICMGELHTRPQIKIYLKMVWVMKCHQ